MRADLSHLSRTCPAPVSGTTHLTCPESHTPFRVWDGRGESAGRARPQPKAWERSPSSKRPLAGVACLRCCLPPGPTVHGNRQGQRAHFVWFGMAATHVGLQLAVRGSR